MRFKSLGALFLPAILLGVSSCSSPGDTVAYQTVEKTIIRGRTRQNEVIQLMGSPNIVTKNSRGEEVWTYSKKSYNPETGNVTSSGPVLSGGAKPNSRGNNTAAFDLILTFDEANIVRDYSVVSSDF